jgi:lycopene beta-cyclase
MDFRTSQKNGTTFFYALPFTRRRALIEYTLFSKDLVADEVYEAALKHYIESDLHIKAYTIVEREFGVIPMTNYPFPSQQNNIVYIGTAGGQTKASSGYTFQFIQKQSRAIVRGLQEKDDPAAYLKYSPRSNFYDRVLLHILHFNKMSGDEIFKQLFTHNKASKIFKFLDNETSIGDELPILKSLPMLLFAKAGLKEIGKF